MILIGFILLPTAIDTPVQAATRPHPYATALQNFFGGASDTGAYLADVPGAQEPIVLAINRDGWPWESRVFYMHNGNLRTFDMIDFDPPYPPWPDYWLEMNSLYVMILSSNNHLVLMGGDEGAVWYYVLLFTEGELRPVTVSLSFVLDVYDSYEFTHGTHNEREISQEELSVLLMQYGLYSPTWTDHLYLPFDRPDDTARILAMTLDEPQLPPPPPRPASPLEGASGWATSELEKALAEGLVPVGFIGSWRETTSREAAAEALVDLIERALGKSYQEIADDLDFDLTNHFSDTASAKVTFLREAGVTDGVGGGRYGVDIAFNRAQIVSMLGRVAENLLDIDASGDNPFIDNVPGWAAPYVGYAVDNGITQGTSASTFDPFGLLTNETTIVLFYRSFRVWA